MTVVRRVCGFAVVHQERRRLSVGTSRLEVTRLLAAIAQAFLGLLGGAVSGKMTLLAAVIAFLDPTLSAVSAHVTDTAARLQSVSVNERDRWRRTYVAGLAATIAAATTPSTTKATAVAASTASETALVTT